MESYKYVNETQSNSTKYKKCVFFLFEKVANLNTKSVSDFLKKVLMYYKTDHWENIFFSDLHISLKYSKIHFSILLFFFQLALHKTDVKYLRKV